MPSTRPDNSASDPVNVETEQPESGQMSGEAALNTIERLRQALDRISDNTGQPSTQPSTAVAAPSHKPPVDSASLDGLRQAVSRIQELSSSSSRTTSTATDYESQNTQPESNDADADDPFDRLDIAFDFDDVETVAGAIDRESAPIEQSEHTAGFEQIIPIDELEAEIDDVLGDNAEHVAADPAANELSADEVTPQRSETSTVDVADATGDVITPPASPRQQVEPPSVPEQQQPEAIPDEQRAQGESSLKELDEALAGDVQTLLDGDFDTIDDVLDRVFQEQATFVQDHIENPEDLNVRNENEPPENNPESGPASGTLDPAVNVIEVTPRPEKQKKMPLQEVADPPPPDDEPAVESITETDDELAEVETEAPADPPAEDAVEAGSTASEPEAVADEQESLDEEEDVSPEATSDEQESSEQREAFSLKPILLRVAQAISLPMQIVPERFRPIADYVALTLVFWVPVVWVIAFFVIGK